MVRRRWLTCCSASCAGSRSATPSLPMSTCGTIRLKLLKIGALVRRSVRRIKFAMALGFPWQTEFALALPLVCNAPSRDSRARPAAPDSSAGAAPRSRTRSAATPMTRRNPSEDSSYDQPRPRLSQHHTTAAYNPAPQLHLTHRQDGFEKSGLAQVLSRENLSRSANCSNSPGGLLLSSRILSQRGRVGQRPGKSNHTGRRFDLR